MLGQNISTQARSIVAASSDVGAKLPPAVLEAVERAARLTSAAQSIYPPAGTLRVAVVAALDEGRDPAADPAVQRAYLAMQLGSSEGGVEQGVKEMVEANLLDVFGTHANAIVKAWRRPFDKAATTVSTCHQRIGNVPLDDASAILARGGDAAATWVEAQAATRVINQIDAAWVMLANLTRFAILDQRFHALRIADATADQWDTAELERRKDVDAWGVQLAGLTLSLADGNDYGRRIAAVQSTQTMAVSA